MITYSQQSEEARREYNVSVGQRLPTTKKCKNFEVKTVFLDYTRGIKIKSTSSMELIKNNSKPNNKIDMKEESTVNVRLRFHDMK